MPQVVTTAVAPPAEGTGNPVVLVVDDDPGVLKICEHLLAPLECEVATAGNGEAALEFLSRRPVAAILTDQTMAGITGTALLERVRDGWPDTVRILFTGAMDPHIAEAALNQAGAFRFLVKPLAGGPLRAAVADALEYRARGDENRRFREEMERLVAEQSRGLAAANVVLENVLRALPVGVLVLGPDRRVTRANAAATRILGREEGELLGRTAMGVGIPCRCTENTPRERPDPCHNRQVEALELWGGRRRTLLWSCEAVGVGNPEAVAGGCVASCLDISEEKDLEVQVFQAKHEIEAIFDSITDPTFVVDKTLRVVRANQALSAHAQAPLVDLLGRACGKLAGGQGGETDACRVFETGKPTRGEFRTEEGAIYKTHFFPLFQRGQVEAVVGRYQEVTAERELEQRLLQSEKMAGIGQLAAGVAHEINNPVGFILSNLNRMGEYVGEISTCGAELKAIAKGALAGAEEPLAAWQRYLDTRARHDLDFLFSDSVDVVAECREGAERIRKIVMDLKTFSHPDGLEWERADLNACFEGTLNIVWNELKYKCEVVKEFGELPAVLCRPQQLNQVFLNLLVNAAHAIAERGTVTLRTWAEGDRVFASVQDTGSGIPPQNLKRIFDPFFTTKAVGQGTGLGLHIAANIVRNHGGELGVVSEVGKGTSFTVALPVTPDLATAHGVEP